jgi:hypothetical protein
MAYLVFHLRLIKLRPLNGLLVNVLALRLNLSREPGLPWHQVHAVPCG